MTPTAIGNAEPGMLPGGVEVKRWTQDKSDPILALYFKSLKYLFVAPLKSEVVTGWSEITEASKGSDLNLIFPEMNRGWGAEYPDILLFTKPTFTIALVLPSSTLRTSP
jgi:hypothetical protein